MRLVALPALFFAVILLASPVSSQRLLSPWDGGLVAPSDAPYNCPAPPVFAKTLNLEGAYIDKKMSIIDEKREAEFQKNAEGPTHLGQFAGMAADAWLSKGSRAGARCVYTLLAAAAAADAWTGKMPTNNSVYMQNWMLSGTAMAYLKVRNSGQGTKEEDTQIQQWFQKLAGRVREYFEEERKRPGSDAWNNHMYWAGLSTAAAGIAANDLNSFIWGLSGYEMGIHAIQPDGSLLLEMGRGRRALHYQLYALAPLVMLAELGQVNGVDLYAERGGAIHRLAQFDLAAMKDPSLLERRAEAAQEAYRPYSGMDIGWAVPYAQRFPNADLSAMISQASTVRFWQWGGAPPGAVQAVTAKPAWDAGLKSKIELALFEAFPEGHSQSFFLGEWCAAGLAERLAVIDDGGDVFTLRNEQGATSSAEPHGPFILVAPAWGYITGVLTPDRSQIDWSNGSYWARCPAKPLQTPVDLTGRWMAQDGSCVIQQKGSLLKIGATRDCTFTGSVDKQGHLTLDVAGEKYAGSLTADGKHINWQDSSYWTRAEVYALEEKNK
jgi:poly(beta-D-mannuronate) lyase